MSAGTSDSAAGPTAAAGGELTDLAARRFARVADSFRVTALAQRRSQRSDRFVAEAVTRARTDDRPRVPDDVATTRTRPENASGRSVPRVSRAGWLDAACPGRAFADVAWDPVLSLVAVLA